MKIDILYGTETGTAEDVCIDIEAAIKDQYQCRVISLEDVAPGKMTADTFYVLVSSTFGEGDPPASAAPFYQKLISDKPDLSHVKFAIFGLGDTSFEDTFAQGSEKLMDQMKACNAVMVGERKIHDASSMDLPEELAIPWIGEILESLPVALQES